MIVENKYITSEEYHLNCDLKMEKPITQELMWKLSELPDSSVVYLEMYDENMNEIASFENWKSNDFNLFKIECISSNIGIKDIVYWELCLEIHGNDVTICFEEGFGNTLNMYMDGTMEEIDNTIKLVGSLDDTHIKVVK